MPAPIFSHSVAVTEFAGNLAGLGYSFRPTPQ